jgi:hypothetical protein
MKNTDVGGMAGQHRPLAENTANLPEVTTPMASSDGPPQFWMHRS